jgi:uncharacterized protein (DUF342 family)
VISSKVYAGQDVNVPVLGSERGVETFVAAGLDVGYERQIEKLDAEAEKARQERVKLRHTLGGLIDDPTRLLEIRPVQKRLHFSLLLRQYFDIEHQIDLCQERRDELESRSREAAVSKIRVTRMVWQGVKLRIGDSQVTIHAPRHGPLDFVPGKKAVVTT